MIKFHLNKLHCAVNFQIIEQRSICIREAFIHIFYKNKSYRFCSRGAPQISRNDSLPKGYDIYLRGGEKDLDYRVVSIKFNNNKERDEFCEGLLYCFGVLKQKRLI